jgi:hypothetical protein
LTLEKKGFKIFSNFGEIFTKKDTPYVPDDVTSSDMRRNEKLSFIGKLLFTFQWFRFVKTKLSHIAKLQADR